MNAAPHIRHKNARFFAEIPVDNLIRANFQIFFRIISAAGRDFMRRFGARFT
ncbi:MAG: hypothetical protein PUG91_02715 [Clostridiales bacterium]|nr:hypothetical protein [Clostridiales bacterium]MDY2870947.1 hypothetical protein [Eubacteriales bacterium]